MKPFFSLWFVVCLVLACDAGARADDIKKSDLFRRIKTSIDAVPAIDTHDHLRSFDEIPFRDETNRGLGMTLHSVWQGSYYPWTNKLSPWPKGASFDEWWRVARNDFDDARATSFYRYLLPAFRDLYGVDFETMTDDQARELNDRIFANYRDARWLDDVVTRRANIELMFVDPYWARLKFEKSYRYSVLVLNVTEMVKGTHPGQFASQLDSPYAFAEREGLAVRSLDDYLAVLDAIFAKAVAADAACLKTTLAYQRSLRFENVPRERAEAIFGRPKAELTADEQRDFEDFMFWRLCELSAKHDLPFQIHTGQARVQGSNPMLLVDLIAANPRTKFVLFHGGFPWVGETGVIAMRHPNVWIDSVWLPTLSYTMAKRAYQEWLETIPSDRIMWGADTVQAEGIYAATEFTRQCLAEALAEKVDRGELREEQAAHIGRQIMRENALKLFPKLRRQLWRKDGGEERR
ncbi:MAG TPA: amidohydrolase family protein [Pirellulales bacterium]|nr:amidohydrolase family protein [Pirellulales bacterium]